MRFSQRNMNNPSYGVMNEVLMLLLVVTLYLGRYFTSHFLNKAKGGSGGSIEVWFPILLYNYFGTLITGRLTEGGHLMEVPLYLLNA